MLDGKIIAEHIAMLLVNAKKKAVRLVRTALVICLRIAVNFAVIGAKIWDIFILKIVATRSVVKFLQNL